MDKFAIPFDPIDDLSCFNKDCQFVAPTIELLLKHYSGLHKGDKSFRSPCLFSKLCFYKQNFKTYGALYQHMSKFHLNKHVGENVSSRIVPVEENISFDVGASIVEHSTFPTPITHPCSQGILARIFFLPNKVTINCFLNKGDGCVEDALKLEGGKFILAALADENLAQSSIEKILPRVFSLMQLVERRCKGELHDSANHMPNIFEGISTMRGQIPFFKKHFGLVMPTEVKLPLNINTDFGRHAVRRAQYFKQQSYVYVPLLDQLEVLLNIDDIYNEIFLENVTAASNSDIFENFKDGNSYKSNALFQNHPNAIQIMLYLDEVQMANPLGSKTLNSKLVFVYFSINNLPSRYRSTLKSIHLLSIFSAKQMTDFGINKMIEPVFTDMKKLECGYDMMLRGKNVKVFGSLVAVSADNLASHQIGGFNANFSKGFRKCRTCLGVHSAMQLCFSDNNFIRRTKETHEEQCKLLNIEGLYAHTSRLYGIKENSILNKLEYFHVIGGLPPDIMHDLLEGIFPYMIVRLLNNIILVEKSVTLKELNFKIKNFNYGANEIRNKPSPIKLIHLKNNKIRQSSSQIWLLAITLPLLVGNRISVNNGWWKAFKIMLSISRIVFSDSLTKLDVLHLGCVINTFLVKVKRLVGNIIPKMHHLIHYPHYVQLLGPLKNFWCMRFESKHAYFKRVQKVTNNSINLPYTLAQRHQLWLAHKMSSMKDGKFLQPEIVRAKLKSENTYLLSSFPDKDTISRILHLSMDSTITEIPWFKINSIKICAKSETIILCPTSIAEDIPFQFGCIRQILTHKNDILLYCQLLKTKQFNEKFQAYEVVFSEDVILCKLDGVNVSLVFSIHKMSSKLFIISKQNLNNKILEEDIFPA